MSDDSHRHNQILTLATEIVASHVSNNSVGVAELPRLIESVYTSLIRLNNGMPAISPRTEPAVSVRASVKPDYIVCLEDGKKLKMLKRHLMTHYKLTPDAYRAKWNLPSDYPMVAPNYAERRRSLAKTIGLGRAVGEESARAIGARAARAR